MTYSGKLSLSPAFYLILWYHFYHFLILCSLTINIPCSLASWLWITFKYVSPLPFMIHYTSYQSQIRFHFPFHLPKKGLNCGGKMVSYTQALYSSQVVLYYEVLIYSSVSLLNCKILRERTLCPPMHSQFLCQYLTC